MRHANSTSFKPGHKRSKQSIAKQVATLKKQYALGLRKPPIPNWTPKTIKKMVAAIRKVNLIKKPIGSRRKHRSSNKCFYWVIKTSDRGRWKFEHRVIMEKKLGRKLRTKEIVHHRNHNSLDNRISNLQLMSHSEHSTLHGKLRKNF